jgi:predicted RND superfamily exporter protein
VRIARNAGQQTVARQVHDISETFAGPERIYAIGDLIVAQAIDDGIEVDLHTLLPLALALILAGFFACFRSMLLPLLIVLLSIIWTLGLMAYLGFQLNVVTSAIPILLVAAAIVTSIGVGIGVDFAIHFFSRLQEERAEGFALEEATRRTLLTAGKAISFDAASNVLGFMVFTFSGFGPIQNLGWLVSLTMVTCAFGTLLLLPPLVATFGERETRVRTGHGESIQPILKAF